ncbi:histidine kinase dimerization/phospho-acceptor domain-containing protein [Nannocystis pusilla]|uniref:histidine kinase dimerization/phospho-acceptor domain-containing protein n=1 Tax=Nannocystis pusilla TaxID=889268 RepID=UPI003B7B6D35
MLLVVLLQAQTLTQARYAALGLGTDPSRPFERWVYAGMTPEQAERIGRAPRPVGLLGAVALHARAVRLRDIAESHERIGFPPGHPPMHSFLGVPILYEGAAAATSTWPTSRAAASSPPKISRRSSCWRARRDCARDGPPLSRDDAGVDVAARRDRRHPRGGDPRRCRGTNLLQCGRPRARAGRGGERAVAAAAVRADGRAAGRRRAAAVAGAARRGDDDRDGVRRADPKGQRVPLLASASPLSDEHGRRVGAVCVLRDISSLKEIERLREQWTAVVAHELRQPVQIIHACARTIERAEASERDPLAAKSAGRILAAAGRLERMIKDLLDAARIEARQLSLRSEAIDVGAVLAEVVARLADTTDRSLRLDVTPGLPQVRGDAVRIEQIAENLLTNALKYGDPAGRSWSRCVRTGTR